MRFKLPSSCVFVSRQFGSYENRTKPRDNTGLRGSFCDEVNFYGGNRPRPEESESLREARSSERASHESGDLSLPEVWGIYPEKRSARSRGASLTSSIGPEAGGVGRLRTKPRVILHEARVPARYNAARSRE